MKMRVAVLLTAFALFCAANAQQCLFDNLIKSAVSAELNKATLSCVDVSASGSLVSCPGGYKPTGCSCGNACGSWDIRSDQICHCQCRNQDWTAARCCKIAVN